MSAPPPNTKFNIYDKRKLNGIIVPLESDSDSDFTPGKIILPEPKKGRKTKDKGGAEKGKRGEAQTRARGTRIDASGVSRENPLKRAAPRQEGISQNPLLEYFGADDLDLHSASDEESDGADFERKSSPSKEVPAEEERRDSEDEVFAHSVTPSNLDPPKATPDLSAAKATQDDSETESEPEEIVPITSLKRKTPPRTSPPPAKRIKPTIEADEESVTESDEDYAVPARPIRGQVMNKSSSSPRLQTDPSSSSTESDSELDGTPSETLQPRPVLPLPQDTPRRLGPLVLDANKGIMVPGSINTYLREYQRDGVRFFWERWKEGRGGLLGDDMGLGKTIQVISFLSAIMRKHGDIRDEARRREYVSELQDGEQWRKKRVLPKANAKWPTCLIICPAPVVGNWRRELETWGYFEVGLYTDARKERKDVLRDFELGRLDVLISTPTLARADIALLSDLPFSCIILDEVHNVKNPGSKTSIAFSTFDCKVRFGLTGTAIQNDYMELWTILDWTSPGMVGSRKQWRGFVARPLMEGQSKGASEEVRTKAMDVAKILKEKLLPNFFLRRTKDVIKDQLPEKIDQVVFCPLTPTQIGVYKRILAVPAVQNIVKGGDPCECGSNKRRKICCHEIKPGDVLRFIAVLIKLSNHLALILPAPTDTTEQIERNRQLSKIAFPNGNIPTYGPAMLVPAFCGKWQVLEALLEQWQKDRTNKALIFTKSTKLLDMLEFHLANKNYGFLKLEGATPKDQRMSIIDKFNSDPHVFIFLISTMVGGTGLNLQGANRVVIFDPNWNPAHDLQAMDRAYRFGQTRDVHVYRLLGAGSLEELIYARQVYKQQQMAIGYQASIQTRYFDGIQGDAQKQGELFGVKNIFKLHEDTLATKQTIEKANIAQFDWALANMDGGKRKPKDASTNLASEAEVVRGKDEAELRGLGSLLFDDDPPPVPAEDEIAKALNAIGVTYRHQNDAILQPSRVEELKAKKAKQRRRAEAKQKRESGNLPALIVEEWPPQRRSRISPEQRLRNRQNALIALGMIPDSSHMTMFAQEFNRKSQTEQDEILATLDNYARDHRTK